MQTDNDDPDHNWSIETIANEQFADNPDIAQKLTILFETYITSARDKEIWRLFDRLLDGAVLQRPNQPRVRYEGRSLFVVGESGAGKTGALKYLFQKRPILAPRASSMGTMMPLVTITAPSPCTLKQLACEILEKIGYPVDKDIRENVAWRIVKQQLRLRQTIILHIDEAQHAVHPFDPQEQQKLADTLKNMMQSSSWPLRLVLSGLPNLTDFLRRDPQLPSRSRFYQVQALQIPADGRFVKHMIKGILETRLGFDISDLQQDEFVLKLCHAASNLMGRIGRFIQGAAEEVIYSGTPKITQQDFAIAYRDMTGCSPDKNIFLVSDWHLIDASAAFVSDDVKTDEKSRGQKRKRKRL